jgi:hypothetical protein
MAGQVVAPIVFYALPAYRQVWFKLVHKARITNNITDRSMVFPSFIPDIEKYEYIRTSHCKKLTCQAIGR